MAVLGAEFSVYRGWLLVVHQDEHRPCRGGARMATWRSHRRRVSAAAKIQRESHDAGSHKAIRSPGQRDAQWVTLMISSLRKLFVPS